MRIDRVRLSNFKCYEAADVSLPPGVTVIHGPNGAGKSSLLDAVFFALYGATALEATLDDLVTRGTGEAEVDLWFTHAGGEYHVERRIRATGERAQTASCVLETPDESIEGATDVREAIVSLLRMDADAFVNCAYVRQGEVNKLISATPTERQAMLDDLLQLGTLEVYRERAREARLGVTDVLTNRRGRLESLEEQIEAKEEQGLHEELNALESERKALETEIERFEENKAKAETTREEARQILAEYEDRRAELESLDEQVTELQEAIRETEAEREAIRSDIAEQRERLGRLHDELDARLEESDLDAPDREAIETHRGILDDREAELRDDLQAARDRATALSNQAENLGRRAEELLEQAQEKRERAASLEEKAVEAEREAADARERLDELEDGMATDRARFEDGPVELGEAQSHRAAVKQELAEVRGELTDAKGDLQSARDRVAEAERLLDAGKCPKCGQPVGDSPHVHSIDDDHERVAELEGRVETLRDREADLEAELDTAESLVEAEHDLERRRDTRSILKERLEELENAIEEHRGNADELRKEAAELESEAEERRDVAREKATAAEEASEAVESRGDELESLSSTRDRIDALEAKLDAVDEAEAEIERLRERRESKQEVKAEQQNRLEALRERHAELREDFDESRVEQARTQKRDADEYLEQVETKLAELGDERDELQNRIGAVENAIDELEALRERREVLSERVSRLVSLEEEASALETLYGDLRTELRQRNIASLERLLNETFDLVYQNDAYARIELDEDYALTVYQKDGEALAPDQLSGGERALFNLSLRTAIYRLLSEGIEGAAPMPPLILDEPTVFLDAGHVSQLVELVESMRDLGVEQIVVVSHDEELLGAADELLTVRKDPTSNRSTVERGAQLEAVAD